MGSGAVKLIRVLGAYEYFPLSISVYEPGTLAESAEEQLL